MILRTTIAVGLLALLSACGLGERFASAEDRINRVLPPGPAVASAVQRLSAMPEQDATAAKAFAEHHAARLKVRALNCADGLSVGVFDSDEKLLRRLNNKTCFEAADAELARWLNLYRAHRLLGLGPLRPIPGQPPKLIPSAEFISGLAFASHAGVALLSGPAYQIAVDIGTGEEIRRDAAIRGFPNPGPMSANGRLVRSHRDGGVSMRMVDTGEVLAEFPANQSFAWLNQRFILTFEHPARDVRLHDMVTGRETVVGGLSFDNAFASLLPIPGSTTQFVAIAKRNALTLELVEQNGSTQAKVTAMVPAPPYPPQVIDSAVTPDGKTLVSRQPAHFSFLDLQDLKFSETSLAPMSANEILPTPDPDEFLVTVALHSRDVSTSVARKFVLSRSKNTLAPTAANSAGERHVWIAPLKRLGLVNDRHIMVLERIDATEAKPADQVVATLLDEFNQRALARFAAVTQAPPSGPISAEAPSARGAHITSVIPPRAATHTAQPGIGAAQPPLAQIAIDAQIEGVGVYQGTGAALRQGMSRAAGVVEVRVRRSTRPTVLVLSSYEPVRWMIITESGARLAAVLLSGYHASTVVGAGNAPIVQLGQDFAYTGHGAGYQQLQRSVERLTGRQIGLFQGRYEGTNFSVGSLP